MAAGKLEKYDATASNTYYKSEGVEAHKRHIETSVTVDGLRWPV